MRVLMVVLAAMLAREALRHMAEHNFEALLGWMIRDMGANFGRIEKGFAGEIALYAMRGLVASRAMGGLA